MMFDANVYIIHNKCSIKDSYYFATAELEVTFSLLTTIRKI